MLRSAPLHYAGRLRVRSRPAHKLGSLPLAEIDAGHRLLRNASAPAGDKSSGRPKRRFAPVVLT
jgi:hypothetical protein